MIIEIGISLLFAVLWIFLGLHFMAFGASLIDLLFGGLKRWKPLEYFHFANGMLVDFFSLSFWKDIFEALRNGDEVIK